MADDTKAAQELEKSLQDEISKRYLQYALSTIMHRALPDARDGLKPVHRRILFAMRELKLGPATGFRKSAKISGDVMGNYHPHGDQAIYDALVRMAQNFNLRYPLVDGQGNFGSIDGDNAAASRYTEARLAETAISLMQGLSRDAVDFVPNYDGTLEEPAVLPSSFPNLLANGASGIAVGMATNIPPHNVGELCDACLLLIKNPDATHDKIAKLVPGPDFPTGGVIVEPGKSIRESYRTGRGSIRLRAKWHVERLERGQWWIAVTEIPYQVQKSRLIEKIAELIQSRKIVVLADVRDESAEDVRIILEPQSRNVNPEALMEALFKLTDLETKFALNMNALIDGRTPRVCSVRRILKVFLEHRRDVLRRMSRHRLGKIDHRLEVLEGYIVAFLNLDRVIEIIRYEDHPKQMLMEEFDLTDIQAEAILNMRLRSLRKLEEMELKKEQVQLLMERVELEDLLENADIQSQYIRKEIQEIGRKFGKGSKGGKRRTAIIDPPSVEIDVLESTDECEPLTVVCSRMGWIRALKGRHDLDQEFKFRDGDECLFALHVLSTDKLLLFGANGRFYTLQASSLPGGRGLGEPVRLMVDLPDDSGIVSLFVHNPDRKLMMASRQGFGFVVAESGVVAMTRNGKQILNIRGPDQAAVCKFVNGDHLAVIGDNRKMLILEIAGLPEMAKGRGVRLQKYSSGGLSDLVTFNLEDGLRWKDPAGRTRREKQLDGWQGKRATTGRKAPHGFPKDNLFT